RGGEVAGLVVAVQVRPAVVGAGRRRRAEAHVHVGVPAAARDLERQVRRSRRDGHGPELLTGGGAGDAGHRDPLGQHVAARAGLGGRRGLGGVARVATAVGGGHDVVVRGVAGQAGVGKRGRRGRSDLGVAAAAGGRTEDLVRGRTRGGGPRHGGRRLRG